MLQQLSFNTANAFDILNHQPESTAKIFELSERSKATSDESDTVETSGNKLPLSKAKVLEIASSLPAFSHHEDQRPAFRPVGETPPPPHVQHIALAFPPPTTTSFPPPHAAKIEPLRITRSNHEGSSKLVSEISVTFSQPMVPLSDLDTIDAMTRPVKLTPQPNGKWRWISDRTIVFSPNAPAFPLSTHFNIDVAAGTRSLLGGKLEIAWHRDIETPTPSVVTFSPNEITDLSPMMIAQFDQTVNSEQAIGCIRAKSESGPLELRPATNREVNEYFKDQTGSRVEHNSRELYFKSVQPLPKNSEISVTFANGIQAIEGPLTSKALQGFAFHTYRPLTLKESESRISEGGVGIAFENALSKETLKTIQVGISPQPINSKRLELQSNALAVDGTFKPCVDYTITVKGTATDIFGQTWQGPQSLTLRIPKAEARIYSESQYSGAQLDPAHPIFRFSALNVKTASVKLYEIESEDLKTTLDEPASPRQDALETRLLKRAKLIEQRSLNVRAPINELSTTDLNLKSCVDKKIHHLLVSVSSPDSKYPLLQWLEISNICVTTFTELTRTYAWVTDLQSGQALAGASVTTTDRSTAATTNALGLAELQATAKESSYKQLVVQHSDDELIADSVQIPNPAIGCCEWNTKVDRYTYRPGEVVTVKGWLRIRHYDENRALTYPTGFMKSISYSVGSGDKPIVKGETPLDSKGGYAFSFQLPQSVPLGVQQINLIGLPEPTRSELQGNQSSCMLQISEFRRPEFEVDLKQEKESVILGENANFDVGAHYRSGGDLPRAKAIWRVSTAPAWFTPKGWEQFSFGRTARILLEREELETNNSQETIEGLTNKHGTDELNVKFLHLEKIEPLQLSTEVTVHDLNNQEWSQNASMICHPSALYAGIRLLEDGEDVTSSIGTPRTLIYRRPRYETSFKRLLANVVVTTVEGKPVSNHPVRYSMSRIETHTENNRIIETKMPLTEGKLLTQTIPTKLNTGALAAGEYVIELHVIDEQERPNYTSIRFKIDPTLVLNFRRDSKNDEPTKITCDRIEYATGDTATLTIKAGHNATHGILFVQNCGVSKTIPINLVSGGAIVKLPVLESYEPKTNLFLLLSDNKSNTQSAFASFGVSTAHHDLKVKVAPAKDSLEPKQTCKIDFDVKSPSGEKVVDAQVAVAVVDENILALSDYRWSNPLSSFYEQVGQIQGLSNSKTKLVKLAAKKTLPKHKRNHQRGQLAALSSVDRYSFGRVEGTRDTNMFQVEPSLVDERHYTSGRDVRFPKTEPAAPPQKTSIAMRTNLNPLAFFNADVRTDANGKATVSFQLPDSVTKYRIMAVAATEKNFGYGESFVSADLPVIVRSTPPRFLTQGDQFEIPVIIQNESNETIRADVVARVKNLIMTDSSSQPVIKDNEAELSGTHIDIPAKNRIKIAFKAQCKDGPEGTVQVAVVAGAHSDALEIGIPIRSAIKPESFATYGQIDSGSTEQKLDLPKDAALDVGGFEVQLSSTAMTELEDPVTYLQTYPYECTEQLSSRLLALTAVDKLASLFPDAHLIDRGLASTQMRSCIKILCDRQRRPRGDFGFWSKDDVHPNTYASIQAVQALKYAARNGLDVNETVFSNAEEFLLELTNSANPVHESTDPKVNNALRAYALNVLDSLPKTASNDWAAKRAKDLLDQLYRESQNDQMKLYARFHNQSQSPESIEISPLNKKEILVDSISLEGLCWLLPVLSQTSDGKSDAELITQIISDHLIETSSAMEVEDSPYSNDGYQLFYSNTRMHAIVLEALIERSPNDQSIPKLLKGLLAARRNGIWNNTQENSRSLLAMAKYFSTYEKATPEFTADLWLGTIQAVHENFVGRSISCKTVNVPMEYLVKHIKSPDVVLSKSGAGRLYYRLGLKYAHKNPYVQARSMGMTIGRSYEAVDSPGDVQHLADGTWRVREGATIRVKLSLSAPGTRHYVAVDDPIAAGLEVLNTELRGTRSVDNYPGITKQKFVADPTLPATHSETKDTGVQLFCTQLARSNYNYSYYARATSPGTYIVPPSSVEEMYTPETFGHSTTDKMIIVSDSANQPEQQH